MKKILFNFSKNMKKNIEESGLIQENVKARASSSLILLKGLEKN
jgi:hypothetical protein